MSRPLFLRIVNEVEQYDPYFIQRTDAIGVRFVIPSKDNRCL